MSDPKTSQSNQGGNPKVTASEKQTEPAFPSVSFACEFAGPKNENFSWPINQQTFRGRWSGDVARKIGGSDAASKLPDIPGFILAFNSAERKLVIYDPLGQPKNKEASKQKTREIAAVLPVEMSPGKDSWQTNMSINLMKTVCFLVRKFLDNSQMVVHSGEVPTIAEIDAMPGYVEYASSHLDQGGGLRLKDLKGYRSPKDMVAETSIPVSMDIDMFK